MTGFRSLSVTMAFCKTLWYILNTGDDFVTPLPMRRRCAWADSDSVAGHVVSSSSGVVGMVDWVVIEDES